MGMWPFSRKSKRRQAHGGAEIPRSEQETMHNAGPRLVPGEYFRPEIAPSGSDRRKSLKEKHAAQRQSSDSNKLQRNPALRRSHSFSPGRRDSIRLWEAPRRAPVPPSVSAGFKNKIYTADTVNQQPAAAGIKPPPRAQTQPSEKPEDWQRLPTLHKRSAQDLARRKSSKKRKEEHDREAEIKAMAPTMPTRPATDATLSGRPMKRDSRKTQGGLNRQNPALDISLPSAESLHSSLSSGSEHQTNYILSAFEMLAPRPTIRYSQNPRYAPGATGFGIGRSQSGRRTVSRTPIPEATLKASKRIDDLADNLDAGELRELMERDQKRREKKKSEEKLKLERRLARRQEQQRVGEASAAQNGTQPPTNMDRGVLGREVVGLGIGTSAVVTSSKRKGSSESDNGRGKRPADSFREISITNPKRPVGDFHDSLNVEAERLPRKSEEQKRVATEPGSFPPSILPARASTLPHTTDISKTEKTTPPKPKTVVPPPASSVRSSNTWTSIFKRGGRTKRDPSTTSFSNTSRASTTNDPTARPGYTPLRTAATMPKRTMSKFREDLPELPVSPPDSRVQSPDADIVPAIRTDYLDARGALKLSSDDPRVRYDTPTSGYRSLETTRVRDETPASGDRQADGPSLDPATALSQSLASIDSEGSWLSGRKRGSNLGSAQLSNYPLHDSASSLQKRYQRYSASDEVGVAKDEYFSRLTPGPEEQPKTPTKFEGEAISTGDTSSPSLNSADQANWGAVDRHPTVVHRLPRATSSEGLLNQYEQATGSDSSSKLPLDANRDSYGSLKDQIEEDEPSERRATSIDLTRNHARRISAGSARLVDMRGKSSADRKRTSS